MRQRDDDLRLERELRGLLGDRDPGPAPYGLRERVDRVPERDASAGRGPRSRVAGPALAIAGLAVAAALIVMLGPLVRLGPSVTGPGASPASLGTMPPGAPWDYPEIRPIWVDTGGQPDPRFGLEPSVVLPALLPLAGLALLVGAALWTVGRRSAPTVRFRGHGLTLTPARQGIALVGLVLLAGAGVLTTQPLTAEVIGYSTLYGLSSGDPEDGDGGDVTGPHPGQGQMLEVMFTNGGLLPVSIVRPERWDPGGLSAGLLDLPLQPERFISARVSLEAAIALPPPDPVTLWPGQSTFVKVLLRHQSCDTMGIPATPLATPWPTAGPDGTYAELPDGTSYVDRTDLPLSTTILGIPRRLDPTLGSSVSMALPDACPPTEPLVPADVSSPPDDLVLRTTDGGGVYGPDQITDAGPPLVLVAGAILAVVVAMAVLVVPRKRKAPAALALVIVVAATAWVGQPGELAEGSFWMPGIGAVASEVREEPETYDVGPGGVLTFGFSIRNAGPVDISLHGANRVAGEIELVGLGRPWGAPSADPTDNVILSPWLTIAPGEQVELLGVARTGSCARRLADGPDGWVMLTAIPFTYERLGIRHEVLVPLGRVVRVPADAACLDRELAGAAGGGLAAFPGDMTLRYGVSGTEPLPVLPILILGAIVVLGLIGRRVVGLRRLAAILAMIVLGVWAAVGAFMPVGVGIDATGHSLGIVDAPAGSGDTTMYVNAPPGDAFALGLVLYGQGSLPIGIEGIYDPNVPDPATIGPASSEPGHWTSAWLSDAPNGGFGDPARPFTPIVLDRVGHGIWLVGSAAGCSVGPSFDPVTPATTETVDFTLIDVRLEVSVLGWPRTISLVDTANLKLLQPTTACDGNANP